MNGRSNARSLEPVRTWLGLVLGLILLMVAAGGITRLTESGLSMVTWEPILGTVPPMSEAEWERRFDQYKQFPEFKQLRPDMTMKEFKSIFFWEYFHRLIGRLMGIVYAIPLAWFWLRGRLTASLKIKLIIGLLLGGGQGVMGWYMVKSGLVDNPFVSHYRLAAHLGLAFMVFSYLLWVLLSILPKPPGDSPASRSAMRWAVGMCSLLVIQILWGAFVAGLNAGFIYNTFPTMQGYWIPPFWNQLEPAWINFIDNPITVQWSHRVLGILLFIVTVIAWFRLRLDPTVDGEKRAAVHLFACLIVFQFWLGVFTLVLSVPIALAVMHQVTACLLAGTATFMIFRFKGQRHA